MLAEEVQLTYMEMLYEYSEDAYEESESERWHREWLEEQAIAAEQEDEQKYEDDYWYAQECRLYDDIYWDSD